MSVVKPVRSPRNPWMIALTVLWALLLAAALLLLSLGGGADAMTYDEPGLPPSQELAGIYYACSGVAVGLALVVVAVQLGVAALRWYLDESSRPIAVPREARPYVRQDF